VLTLLSMVSVMSFPYCNHNVSTCCSRADFKRFSEVFNASNLLTGETVATERPGVPTCDLLNLVPNASEGLCKTSGGENVCSVLSGSAVARSRAESGRPLLGIYTEPGLCKGLSADRPPIAGVRAIEWQNMEGAPQQFCFGVTLNMTTHNNPQAPSLLTSIKCTDDNHMRGSQGVEIEAAWLPEDQAIKGSLCAGASPQIGVHLYPSSWKRGQNLPRWQCIDVPTQSSLPTEPYRILVISAGDLPCQRSSTTTTTTEVSTTTASTSNGVRAVALLSLVITIIQVLW